MANQTSAIVISNPYFWNFSLTDRLCRPLYARVAHSPSKLSLAGRLTGMAVIPVFLLIDTAGNATTESLSTLFSSARGLWPLISRIRKREQIELRKELLEFLAAKFDFTKRCLYALFCSLKLEALRAPDHYLSILPSTAEAQAEFLLKELAAQPFKPWKTLLAFYTKLITLPRLPVNSPLRGQALNILLSSIQGQSTELQAARLRGLQTAHCKPTAPKLNAASCALTAENGKLLSTYLRNSLRAGRTLHLLPGYKTLKKNNLPEAYQTLKNLLEGLLELDIPTIQAKLNEITLPPSENKLDTPTSLALLNALFQLAQLGLSVDALARAVVKQSTINADYFKALVPALLPKIRSQPEILKAFIKNFCRDLFPNALPTQKEEDEQPAPTLSAEAQAFQAALATHAQACQATDPYLAYMIAKQQLTSTQRTNILSACQEAFDFEESCSACGLSPELEHFKSLLVEVKGISAEKQLQGITIILEALATNKTKVPRQYFQNLADLVASLQASQPNLKLSPAHSMRLSLAVARWVCTQQTYKPGEIHLATALSTALLNFCVAPYNGPAFQQALWRIELDKSDPGWVIRAYMCETDHDFARLIQEAFDLPLEVAAEDIQIGDRPTLTLPKSNFAPTFTKKMIALLNQPRPNSVSMMRLMLAIYGSPHPLAVQTVLWLNDAQFLSSRYSTLAGALDTLNRWHTASMNKPTLWSKQHAEQAEGSAGVAAPLPVSYGSRMVAYFIEQLLCELIQSQNSRTITRSYLLERSPQIIAFIDKVFAKPQDAKMALYLLTEGLQWFCKYSVSQQGPTDKTPYDTAIENWKQLLPAPSQVDTDEEESDDEGEVARDRLGSLADRQQRHKLAMAKLLQQKGMRTLKRAYLAASKA